MQQLHSIQLFIQVIAIIDLIGIAIFVIIASVMICSVHSMISEIYKEFKKGKWRFIK